MLSLRLGLFSFICPSCPAALDLTPCGGFQTWRLIPEDTTTGENRAYFANQSCFSTWLSDLTFIRNPYLPNAPYHWCTRVSLSTTCQVSRLSPDNIAQHEKYRHFLSHNLQCCSTRMSPSLIQASGCWHLFQHSMQASDELYNLPWYAQHCTTAVACHSIWIIAGFRSSPFVAKGWKWAMSPESTPRPSGWSILLYNASTIWTAP